MWVWSLGWEDTLEEGMETHSSIPAWRIHRVTKSQTQLSDLSLWLWTVAHQAPCPWDSPGNDTGVGRQFLFQGIFPTQGLNSGLPHSRQNFYHLSHQQSPSQYSGWLWQSRNFHSFLCSDWLLSLQHAFSSPRNCNSSLVIIYPNMGLETLHKELLIYFSIMRLIVSSFEFYTLILIYMWLILMCKYNKHYYQNNLLVVISKYHHCQHIVHISHSVKLYSILKCALCYILFMGFL